MYQPIGDGARLGACGAVGWVEPAGIGELFFLEGDVAAFIFGGEAQHELCGEGPALAAEVTDVLDGETCLFAHFAGDGLFEGLTCFDKTGNTGIDILVALHMPCQKYLAVLLDAHDDTRVDAWEDLLMAVRAETGGEVRIVL